MANYPGDPRDVYRRRRGLIAGVQGVLFLPAQGGWLLIAIGRGGAWWAFWAMVLAGLVTAAVLVSARARRRGLAARPPLVTAVMLFEVLAIAGWIVTAELG